MLKILSDYKAWIADPKRARSPELDFGVSWNLTAQCTWPFWRVSWIDDTGELYARELGPDSDRFIILGYFPTRKAVEKRLTGWSDSLYAKSLADWFGDDIMEARLEGLRGLSDRELDLIYNNVGCGATPR